MPADPATGRVTRGRPRFYPWEEWADLRRHDIRHGIDFDIPILEMARQINKHARKRGLRVMTKFGEAEVGKGVIRFQFVRKLWWE